jgi:alpha-beta hydrolase superfamily lysophospholipase
MFFAVGEAARRHGWNCLIFEGPGQGSALRLNKLPFRYDWEAVVTPVVDFALNLRGVDPERIALLGMSMGGYLAPRAAAFEHRIAACVAYDGVFQMAAGMPKPPQAHELDSTQRAAGHAYEALHCPKTFLTFTAAEGAGEHCHEGALTLFHQRLFDWLDDTLKS